MTAHELTAAKQGEYHYTVGPYAEPVLEIEPGDTVAVETEDAFEGAIETEDDLPSEVLGEGHNPQNGPITVAGATPGDALAVTIERIEPRGPQPRGTTCTVPYFGGLSATDRTAMLHDPLPEIVKKLRVTTEGTVWDDDITIPYEPFVGTIGTSPRIDSVNALTPFKHGGNMDLPDVRPGNTIYLPVEVEGGYLYLGDCHAAQGDGELCGVAIEIPTTTTITVDVVEDWDLEWPRLESEDFVMSVGSARPMEDAARTAYADLVAWLADDYGFDEMEAYMLLTQVGQVRLGNMVDPNYTVGAGIDKSYL
ncbi:acetamidase/formamidase family protein [Haloplanus pelagicus]|uniref:acetamidase/formamidase family protein n=1 Tax=Haloplanus pelagicus TaxID=2949995 RepID=UPI0020413A57|nr:acetamidase/formamidase family protein [Haloplanus sp. HW8-1]